MGEQLDEWLEEQFRGLVRQRDQITTLSTGQINRVVEVSSSGVTISTGASDAKGRGPQLVPAWMINVAWQHLRSTGSLTNLHLQANDGLRVRRSSAVCALLATLPGVTVASSRPIELRYRA